MTPAKAARGLMLAWIGGLALYLLLIAASFRIDYYDGIDNLWDAKVLAGGATGFAPLRPLLLPILLAVPFWLERVLGTDGLGFTLSHMVVVACFPLLLIATYKLLRLGLDVLPALAGVVLLSLDSQVIHAAPFVMNDLPAAMLETTASYWYLRSRQRASTAGYALAGVLMAATMSIRYNLLPIPIAVVGCYEVLQMVARSLQARRLQVDPARELGRRLALLVVLPVVLTLLLPILVYSYLGISSPAGALPFFRRELIQVAGDLQGSSQHPPLTNLRFLAETLTLPVLLCASMGLITRFRRQDPVATFCLLWFSLLFTLQTVGFGHKVVRYLLPTLPPLYYFAAVGVEQLALMASGSGRSLLARAGSMTGLAVVMVVSLTVGVQECAKFTDPVYSADFERTVSRHALAAAGEHQVHWVGNLYALHPADYVFDPEDDYDYVYHFSFPAVAFWTHRGIPNIVTDDIRYDAGSGVALVPGVGKVVKDGDVLIVNVVIGLRNTRTLASARAPLVLERVRLRPLIPGMPLADGAYELYAGGPGSGPSFLRTATVSGGQLLPAPSLNSGLLLLSYQPVTTFAPP